MESGSLEEEVGEISGDVVVADAGFFCEEAGKSFRADVKKNGVLLTVQCPYCGKHDISRFRNY